MARVESEVDRVRFEKLSGSRDHGYFRALNVNFGEDRNTVSPAGFCEGDGSYSSAGLLMDVIAIYGEGRSERSFVKKLCEPSVIRDGDLYRNHVSKGMPSDVPLEQLEIQRIGFEGIHLPRRSDHLREVIGGHSTIGTQIENDVA